MKKVKIWDFPTRLFHWGLAIAVAGAYLSEEFDAMHWHEYFGIEIAGLLVFRLVWGISGSAYARFNAFLPSLRNICDYIGGRWQREGHNPLGALSVWAILVVMTTQVITGLFANDDSVFSGPLSDLVSKALSDNMTGLHRQMEWIILSWVGLHVVTILFYISVKKHNILIPMITGWKHSNSRHIRQVAVNPIALSVAIIVTCVAVYFVSGEWIALEKDLAEQADTPDF